MNSLADAAAEASAAAAAAAAAANTSPRTPGLSTIRSTPAHPAPWTSTSPNSISSPAADMSKPAAAAASVASDTPVRRALLDTEKPEKRGSNLACLKCRAIKVKCSRANAHDDRCKRCNRLDLQCEFKEHHRGRKPKKRPRTDDADSTGLDEEDQLEDDDAELGANSANSNASPVRAKHRELSRSPPPPPPSPPQLVQPAIRKIEPNREPAPKLPSPKGSVHGRWFGPYLQPIPSFEDSLFPRKPHPHHGAPHVQDQAEPIQSGPSYPSAYHDRSRDLPPLSVAPPGSTGRSGPSPKDQSSWDRTSAWSSAQNAMQRTHPPASSVPVVAADLGDDAVRQHLISLDQAHELFDYFFAELNPPLALLDASLHTIDYCRQNTPILFSVIVAVASRFFQPHLHRQCQRVAKAILHRAAVDELASLDHIQALILVITWKEPGDRTILRKAVRAMGYAYELGLHAAFEALDSDEVERVSEAPARGRSDSFSQRYRRRLERDRQRTWIVLCLVHELVRRDERNSKARARIIPLDDYPDPYVWMQKGGDVLLSVDSRLAWSLDMSILTRENEALLDMIQRSHDATPFASFFARYRARLDVLRRRYFDVRDGVYHPRFPMDTSAVAELPYLDGFRDFYICQSTWHWAAKLSATPRLGKSELAQQQESARSAFWFAQTVDGAMRCLRLFACNLCKPGYVRVGHDYLVITASEVAKWFFLYRDHLDAATVVAGVGYLRETLRECKQPQRLASGEVVETEREAPGYLVRFIGAIFDAGLDQSYEQAKLSLAASVERLRARPYHWTDAHGAGGEARERALSNAGADDVAKREREREREREEAGTRRPGWMAHASYQERAGERSFASPLPRGRSELTTSYERGSGAGDKPQTSPTTYGGASDSIAAATSGTGFGAVNVAAPHPAYLASPGANASGAGQGIAPTLPAVQGSGWPSLAPVAPSWIPNGYAPSQTAATVASPSAATDLGGVVGLSGLQNANAVGGKATGAANVVPLAADIGKNSIEGLAACLTTRDLTYWQDILGFDLATPAV